MIKYFWQENNGDIEVICETSEGFEWICDCGNSKKASSIMNATVIVSLLNKNLQEILK